MNESFSQDTKNEICTVRLKNKCCRESMLYGMLYGCSCFSPDRILLETENPSVFSVYKRLIKEVTEIHIKNDISVANCNDKDIISVICDKIGVSDRNSINLDIMKCDGCRWSFVRGVFLSCGTVTSPDNAYHMEFLFDSLSVANNFCDFLSELAGQPKVIERHGGFGVYYKDSDTVVDVLGQMGASASTFKLLDVKIYRDLRNNINRVSNCELANLGKTLNASGEQVRAIEKIVSSGKADELSSELRQTLDLRMAFPNDTLLELALRHVPPITKSGVNHRLKKLIEFSKKC